ncbi:MAG: MarR family transcriptional regulator [Nanoarchaeota archaeon]
MKAADPDNPILTHNDQEVLKNILDMNRHSDSEIARKLRLSQQAIFKIRKKLEDKGIIEGYMPIINFRKIGINVLVVLTIRVQPIVWKEMTESQIAERIRDLPNVITALRIPESEITHLLVMGFTSIDQKDRILMKLQTRFSDEIEIKDVFPCSVDRVITMSPISLLHEIVEHKEPSLDHLFLKR